MFVIAPALADEGILNFADSGTKKLYNKSTEPISDVPYNLSTENLTTFLCDVEAWSAEYGWEAILNIPKDSDAEPKVNHPLTSKYGNITLDQVNYHTGTYF